MSAPLLSICIATRNRASALAETLDNILISIGDRTNVELVIVDGASGDNTAEVVSARGERNAAIRYYPQSENSGIDGDFDKAVQLANGTYCWLFSDDDFLRQDAVPVVLDLLQQRPDAVIVDAEVKSADMSRQLAPHRLPVREFQSYTSAQMDQFLSDCATHLTFLGAVIVRREIWLSRERRQYYGTEFVHIGVLFQAPSLSLVLVSPETLITIRYGVGNWISRSFDVWMYKWPRLIWSFEHLSENSRAHVISRFPWKSPYQLFLARAKGWYSIKEFNSYVRPRATSYLSLVVPLAIALVPGRFLCRCAIFAIKRLKPSALGGLYDLERSRFAPKNLS